MKTNYSWETEEDGDWEAVSESQPPPRRDPRRALVVLGLAIVVVFGLILVIFNRRLESREEIVRQSVVAAHRTWEQAVARQDLELFTSLIAREDSRWFQTQRNLLMSGRVFDRSAFGLEQAIAAAATPSVELDANWRRAEVAYEQQYTAGDAPRPITLRISAAYQLRGSRWQAAPLPEAFWGDTLEREFGRLSVTYPEHDASLVERLAADLAGEIDALCAEPNQARECSADYRIPLVFATDAQTLFALGEADKPAVDGRSFVLPAPSLVGLPADDLAYEALYHGYTERVLTTLRNNLALPIALPSQEIAALCFPALDQGLTLFTYEPAADVWTQRSDPRRFSYLQPLPEDSGLVLRAGFPGVRMALLEILLLRGGQERTLFKEGTTELSVRLDGIPEDIAGEALLLNSVQGSSGLTDYKLLPLDSCLDGSCDVRPLSGFPLWAPGGGSSLVLEGSDLYLGDADGEPVRRVGRGFSPFWVNEGNFGYVRLMDVTENEGPQMALVLQSATTGQEWPIVRSSELLSRLDTEFSGAFRILYATASPADPNILFLAGTPVAGGGRPFYVLQLRLSGDAGATTPDITLDGIETLLALEGMPAGDARTLTPTGYPPFSLSTDGRWLLAARFADTVTNTWHLHLVDIASGESRLLTLNYPAYPSPFPFYDWSADSNWLIVVDDGFMRLLAPAYNYERIVTHNYAACRHPAWIDPSVTRGGSS